MVGRLADPEPFPQHLLFARRQGLQRAVDLPLQIVPDRGFQRRHGFLVFDKVAQMAVLFLADRRFQRNRLARDLENLPDLVERQIHPLGDFLR